jgi:hypothetical protein
VRLASGTLRDEKPNPKNSIASKTRETERKKLRARPQTPQAMPKSPDVLARQSAVTNPAHASPGALLALQGGCDNQAVQHLIQTKLTVGASDDMYEQEADRVARQLTLENSCFGMLVELTEEYRRQGNIIPK